MTKLPSLLTLCIDTLKNYIIYGNDDDGDMLKCLYELPSEIFDCILIKFPALALHKLHLLIPCEALNDLDADYGCFENGRKRTRCGKLDVAWKNLYSSRWPELREHDPMYTSARHKALEGESNYNWQQRYWEVHMQNCFDAAAERAMLPSFDGCVGQIEIPSVLIKAIGYENDNTIHNYSRLRDHCREFGSYIRFLKLQNVFCNPETLHLLTNSKLEGLLLRRISSKNHVDGLCRILNQNKKTITSLKFMNCRISLDSYDAICNNLNVDGTPTHLVQHFDVISSKLSESNSHSLPPTLSSFLSSRSLVSLSFCDNRIGKQFAKLTLMTLLDSSSPLHFLEISENNISGWLSDFRSPSRDTSKSLPSLRTLNLRGNNLCKNDMEDLRSALTHMPFLETLHLADNPIGDDGIKSLIPYFVKNDGSSPLVNLNLKNCKLSSNGATELLEVLAALKYPLTSLSLADNDLGSQVAQPLGDFLGSSINSLDIRDIGLGSSGFLELRISMPKMVNLKSIDISENRGGIQAAEFIGELIVKAPQLGIVNAGYNLMPSESIDVICSALKIGTGKLERIDLTGNQKLCEANVASTLARLHLDIKPTVFLLPNLPSLNAPYDDDP